MALKETDQKGDVTNIDIAFQAEIGIDYTIEHVDTLEYPNKLLCFIFDLRKGTGGGPTDPYTYTGTVKHNLSATLDSENNTHVVSFILLHNPGQDQDSMRTTDVPML